MSASKPFGRDSRDSKPKAATLARVERKRAWLRRHGCPELLQACENEKLSLSQGLKLARLSPAQQRRTLVNERERQSAQLVAADVINRLLSDGSTPISLAELSAAIRAALYRSPH
jgi:hypothetical protein